MRPARLLLAFALGAVVAAGCRVDPPGACVVTADCEAGLRCEQGICVGCSGDADCGSWQACSPNRRCLSRDGFCGGDAECQAWERCTAAHHCALRAGQCALAIDCAAWEGCTDHACQALPGRCSAQADCAWYLGCGAGHVCGRPSFDPASVLIWGTLDASSCGRGALAPADHPEQARIGFDCAGQAAPAAIGAGGDVYYTAEAGGLRGVSRLEPDAAPFDAVLGRWVYPASPTSNDHVVVPGDACAGAGVDHWLLQGGTGAVRYACPSLAGGFDYFDAAAAPVFSGTRVLAWTAGDLKLVAVAGGFQVVDAAGLPAAVSGLGAGVVAIAERSTGEAFWLVDGSGFGAPRRYTVRGATASFDGTYADAPREASIAAPDERSTVLDGVGALVQRASAGGQDLVVRRPLAPAASTVLYRQDAAPAGANAFTRAVGFDPYVLLEGGPLVTGR